MRRSRLHLFVAAAVLVSVGIATAVARSAETPPPGSAQDRLRNAATWMYQIQDLDRPGAVELLAASSYDVVVIDPTNTIRGSRGFDVAGAVRRLKQARPGRLVLGYLDIGEAEEYRTYWKRRWRAPRARRAGRPSFIVARDPDGWEGNYPVAFWDRRWKRLMINGKRSAIRKLLRAGFDGVYMDWVEAYDDVRVRMRARRIGIDPERAMVSFIRRLRTVARRTDPDFLVVAQNAPYLIGMPGYVSDGASVIDGLALEDIWFRGTADARWEDPAGGDIPNDERGDYSTKALIRTAKRYRRAGLPVFTVDYALQPRNATRAYRKSRRHGFIPLVTRVSLSRMTQTPPP